MISLREVHIWHMTDKRSGTPVPTVGTIVLLIDDDQPRNTWRMGRISALKPSKDNAVREVEVTLPHGHVLRRPLNLLVPLEIEGSQESQPIEGPEASAQVQKDSAKTSDEHNQCSRHYDLRRRPRVDYSEKHGETKQAKEAR
ncbi:hypothetical protein ANCDUO_15288 [Ancylostoma duodenale]|uniref:DUF5641 domain-containing protein n=1 Tax=Ancylostoma duodenale TaxID=51022 RepID=A0A0C2CE18_9BILA|nr:hypothetical protein ANCDUO_15288 [Ancylostoma duodenale]